MKCISGLIFFFAFVCSANGRTTVEIVAVGDILLARGVEKKIVENGTDYPFEKVREIIAGADLAFGNLENPLTEECERLDKKYSFRAKPEYAKILRAGGFDILSVANNHTLDCGARGLAETLVNLEKENLQPIGLNVPGTPLLVEVKGIKFAFLGFTAVAPGNTEAKFPQISEASAESISKAVADASRRADIVVVSVHWGTEYNSHPNAVQKELAKAAVNAGADAVIGHHPHVLQGLQNVCRNGKRSLIVWSLGNFLFDSPVGIDRRLGESAILKLRFDKNGLAGSELIPVVIEDYRPVVAVGEKKDTIISRLNDLSGRFEKVPCEPGTFKKQIETDLDGDGTIETIDLDAAREKTLEVRHGEERLWLAVPSEWKPWKLAAADVDGDGKREIVIGVFKATKFFPEPHNCLFIYGWNGTKGFPKWLGSSLGRPFEDFLFAALDEKKGDELIAAETTLEGKKILSVYKWNGFGFTLEWERGVWNDLKIVGAENGRITVEADGERLEFDKLQFIARQLQNLRHNRKFSNTE